MDAKNRVLLDPQAVDDSLRQLILVFDVDAETLPMIRRVVRLFTRPVAVYVDEISALYYDDVPLIDRFTFNMKTDELVLFARDAVTLVDGLVEMAMFMAGFATLIGVDEEWKKQFAIGAWKPVKNTIKREVGIPVLDEPLWVVGLPASPDEAMHDDIHPFRTLVARLDKASFSQMVHLAARDDVEVNFPNGTDPRVIQVYIRMKTAMYQVADGLSLQDWRQFNRRLRHMIQELDEEYNPRDLPLPAWWKRFAPDNALSRPGTNAPPEKPTRFDDPRDWNPFEPFLDELFNDDTDYWDVME